MKHLRAFSCAVILGMTASAAVHADAANEARLRDQLRQTMLDLRQAQDQNSELQVKVAAGANSAPPQAAASPKQSCAGIEKVRGAMKQEMAQVEAERDDYRAQVATLLQQLSDANAKFVAARASAVVAADADKKLADSVLRFNACLKDNRDLVDISGDLLQRYHDMGVMEALWTKEPLTGLGRLHRERLVEKYRGAVIDATVAEAPSGTRRKE